MRSFRSTIEGNTVTQNWTGEPMNVACKCLVHIHVLQDIVIV